MDKKNEQFRDKIIIKLNKSLYSKEILFQACYVMLEKCYFLLDEKENYFIVELFSKENENKLKELKKEFLDELIEAASYIDQIKRTSQIRELLLEKALTTQIIDEKKIEKDNTNNKQ